MLHIYGIKNCSTMKKAFDVLDQLQLSYTLHDYKKQGIDVQTLQCWADQVGLDVLLNKKGTTWRKFTPEQQQQILSSPEHTLKALSEHPSMIKRPVLVTPNHLIVGLDESRYQQLTTPSL